MNRRSATRSSRDWQRVASWVNLGHPRRGDESADPQATQRHRRCGRRWSRSSCRMGRSRNIPRGSGPREVAEGIGKRLAEAAVAAVADGTVVDLDRPLENGTDGADRAADPDLQGPRGARRPAALDRAHHGPGHHAALPRRQARLRADHRERLLLRRRPRRPPHLRGRLPAHRGRDGQDRQGRRAVRAVQPARRRGPPVRRRPGPGLKVEHIDDELHKYGILSFYRQGEFVDLCRGPHIPHAGKVGAFKLLSIAGAYWKGQTDRKSSSASTAPPSSTRRSSTPTSPRSRRPRSATTACSARSSSCSRSARWSARG